MHSLDACVMTRVCDTVCVLSDVMMTTVSSGAATGSWIPPITPSGSWMAQRTVMQCHCTSC